ncbi:MAG: hypothetical protein SGI77_24755 [Pirellulaceae bacterium]|nr:hypothetical protein [Pirellulaceae bacterium]
MILGSIVEREAVTMPRKAWHFLYRSLFMISIFVVICTTWILLAGVQPLTKLGDLSRFSSMIFQIIAPLQLVVLMFASCLAGCTAVSNEKDRSTLILILMTTLSNWELVLGKASAGFLVGLNLLLSSSIAMIGLSLLGGVSPMQILEVTWIGFGTIVASCAWGSTIAFWRDKTFQAIAITLLGLVLYFGSTEFILAGGTTSVDGRFAEILNPVRAVMVAARPIADSTSFERQQIIFGSGVWMLGIGATLIALSIARLRVWNPSREGRPKMESDDKQAAANVGSDVDANAEIRSWRVRNPRKMWDNPILWREVRTWAYGRKVLLIRFSYLLFGAIITLGLQSAISQSGVIANASSGEEFVPATAKLVIPLLVVSVIIINALAVNSITNERDVQSLDLLLVSEITPKKFLFGKLFGVLYVTKEMVLVPIAIGAWMYWLGAISGENLCFLLGGLVIMDIFVAMLGLHCGMIYSRSRSAIVTSLGTVFFLFLGILTCMLIMISFRGSFERQLAPFLAIILGGGSGLYVALGAKNPSPAIALASFGLPFMTFFAITSFILQGQELTVFSVIATSYGFATLAMMIPALSEFEFSFGRSQDPNSNS